MLNSKKFVFIKFLLLLITFVSTVHATVDTYEVYYFNDKNNTLSLEEVQKEEFKKISNKVSQGYKKGASWIRIEFYNTHATNNFVFEIDEIFYEKVTFYDKILGAWLEKNFYLSKKLNQRDIPYVNPIFDFYVEQNQHKTLYLKLESKYSHFGKINIYKKNSFFIGLKNKDYLYILALLSLFFAFCISALILLKQKDKVFRYYMLYTFCLLIYTFKMSDFIVYVNLQDYIFDLHFIVGFAIAFFVLFSKEILEIDKCSKNLGYFINIIAILQIISSTMMIFYYSPWNIILNSLITFIFILFLPISFYTYKKGNNASKYYFIVVFIYFITIIFYTLMLAGIVEYNIFNRHGYVFAISLEIIAFTIMIINKFNKVQEEKIDYNN